MSKLISQIVPPLSECIADKELYLRGSVTTLLLFYSSLWIIKLSFSVFFHNLGVNVQGQNVLCCCISAITADAYFVCFGNIPYHCLILSFVQIASEFIFVPLDTL